MIQSWSLVLAVCISYTALAFPQNGGGDSDARDLKHTFANEGEIPEGFFDAPEPQKGSSPPSKSERERRAYPGCQDGSGGMCIPAGQCPADLKAPGIPGGRAACDAGQECCYGGPMNSSTPCRDKGGECTAPPRSCGKGPQIRSGTECDHANGEICCIWTF